MNARVDEELCIGCSACEDACPAVFKMEGDKAIIIANPVPQDAEASCKEAAETCPVDAIVCE